MDIKGLVHTEALKDKSLWLAIAAPAIVLLAKVFGFDLSNEQVGTVLGSIVAFIVASKAKQAVVVKEVVRQGLLDKVEESKKLLDGGKSDAK